MNSHAGETENRGWLDGGLGDKKNKAKPACSDESQYLSRGDPQPGGSRSSHQSANATLGRTQIRSLR